MGTPSTGVYTYSITNRTILAQKWGESIKHQPISDCRQNCLNLNGLLMKRQNDNLSPGVVTEENSFSGYAAHINFGMTLESVYLCVSMAYLHFQIILLWYLSVTGERMCTEHLSMA